MNELYYSSFWQKNIQYYFPMFLENNIDYYGNPKPELICGWISPFVYKEYPTLMSTSYVNSRVLNMVEWMLRPGGCFYMTRLVWASLSGDEELIYDPKKNCNIMKTLGAYHNYENHSAYSGISEEDVKEYRYIVNHTLKLYVDKYSCGDENIHPLPILTCEGNGRGMGGYSEEGLIEGDYYGSCEEYVGTWARHVISLEKNMDSFPGYTRLELTLKLDFKRPEAFFKDYYIQKIMNFKDKDVYIGEMIKYRNNYMNLFVKMITYNGLLSINVRR